MDQVILLEESNYTKESTETFERVTSHSMSQTTVLVGRGVIVEIGDYTPKVVIRFDYF